MSVVAVEFIIIFILIMANGVFSLSEIAVLASRKARLQHLAHTGSARAGVALELAKAPSEFLATIQSGMTLIGVLTGAFSGATLAEKLGGYLDQLPVLSGYGEAAALGIVVVAVTYLTLILGELVPKRLALNHPEPIATVVAIPIRALSRAVLPVVRLMSASTEVVLWLLGARSSGGTAVTEDEIKLMLREATRTGTFEELEREIVESVFRLGDRKVSALMTRRQDIVWLDLSDSAEDIRRTIERGNYSHLPVADGAIENLRGIVQAKDLLGMSLARAPLCLKDLLQEPLFVPESMPALKVLELFRTTRVPVVFVIDEYGILQGLVTVMDILEVLTGIMSVDEGAEDSDAVRRDDGSWLIDGRIAIDRFKAIMNVDALPAEDARYYQTLGGFVMMQLGRVPNTGDQFDWNTLHFEVVDMDGPRVDKVLVYQKPGTEAAEAANGADASA